MRGTARRRARESVGVGTRKGKVRESFEGTGSVGGIEHEGLGSDIAWGSGTLKHTSHRITDPSFRTANERGWAHRSQNSSPYGVRALIFLDRASSTNQGRCGAGPR